MGLTENQKLLIIIISIIVIIYIIYFNSIQENLDTDNNNKNIYLVANRIKYRQKDKQSHKMKVHVIQLYKNDKMIDIDTVNKMINFDTVNKMINFDTVNKQISKTDMDSFNESINNFVSENITKAASSCAASSSQVDKTKIGNIVAKGPGSKVTIGVESDQKTNINMHCLQRSLQQTTINNNIATAIVQLLTKNINRKEMTKLVSDAESKAKKGGGYIGMSESSSKINTNVTNEKLNYTNVKLENLVKNTVQNKTENKNIHECGTKISQNLRKEIGDILAIDEITAVQYTNKQITESIAKCTQLNSQVSDITSAIVNFLGFTVIEEKIKEEENKIKNIFFNLYTEQYNKSRKVFFDKNSKEKIGKILFEKLYDGHPEQNVMGDIIKTINEQHRLNISDISKDNIYVFDTKFK